jgi:hypothetical protein
VIVGAVAVGACGGGEEREVAVLECAVAIGDAGAESVEFPLIVNAPIEVSVDSYSVVFERVSNVRVQAQVSTAAGVSVMQAAGGVPINPELTTLAGSAWTEGGQLTFDCS